MWTSAELKERAKGALTGSYWKAFGISLILTIISGRGGGSPNSFNWRSDTRPEDFSVETWIVLKFSVFWRFSLGYSCLSWCLH